MPSYCQFIKVEKPSDAARNSTGRVSDDLPAPQIVLPSPASETPKVGTIAQSTLAPRLTPHAASHAVSWRRDLIADDCIRDVEASRGIAKYIGQRQGYFTNPDLLNVAM